MGNTPAAQESEKDECEAGAAVAEAAVKEWERVRALDKNKWKGALREAIDNGNVCGYKKFCTAELPYGTIPREEIDHTFWVVFCYERRWPRIRDIEHHYGEKSSESYTVTFE